MHYRAALGNNAIWELSWYHVYDKLPEIRLVRIKDASAVNFGTGDPPSIFWLLTTPLVIYYIRLSCIIYSKR